MCVYANNFCYLRDSCGFSVKIHEICIHKAEGLKSPLCLITQRMGLVCMDFNNQLLFVCTDKDKSSVGTHSGNFN